MEKKIHTVEVIIWEITWKVKSLSRPIAEIDKNIRSQYCFVDIIFNHATF